MNNELLAALLGLGSAALWGSGDFFGGLASRRASHYAVVFFAQSFGTLAVFVLILLTGQPIPPLEHSILGVGAGVFGALGLLLFYRAMAVTKMSVAAPITAVMTGILPVIAAIALEGTPELIQIVGMLVALAAIAFISREDNTHIRLSEVRLPLLAGIGFGLYLTLLARASEVSPLWPVFFGRCASVTLVGLMGWRMGVIKMPVRRVLLMMAAAGILDTLGNALYAAATQVGRDDIAAILSSLYPAATVGLAWLILKERLNRVQWIGVGLAFIAIVLITL